jgi:hypothetical protein
VQDFYNSSKFIFAFLIMCIIIQMTFNDKALTSFLTLVLISMVLINSDKVANLIEGGFN